MSRRSKHASHSRWLVEQVHWEIKQKATTTGRIRRAWTNSINSWDRHPFLWSGIVQAVVFLIAWASGAITLFPNLTGFHVDDPSALIGVAWQVLAGFASIAFAGLAVLMQLTSEPVVTSRGVRQVLFRESQFRPVLAFSITGAIQLGVATAFLNQPEAAMVELAVVALTILWIGWSYARVGKVYATPGEALRLGEQSLLRDLRASMREAHARAAAESRLHAVVPREWQWSSTATVDGAVLVTAMRTGTLLDVDIELLADIAKQISDRDSSALAASDAPNSPVEPSTANAPELRILVSIGSSVDPGDEIFVLKNPVSYTGDLAQLQDRLARTLRWGGRSS